MQTHDYLALMRKVKKATDYRIGIDYDIKQPIISRYKLGKLTLSERHAFIFARELGNCYRRNQIRKRPKQRQTSRY